MELKKDDQAVAIDMLLIVNSEKRRAAQGAHSDRQADPQPQRRGGLPAVGNGIRKWQKCEGTDPYVGTLAEKQHAQQPQVITSYDNQAGTQLTVEVHPRDAMPQLLKKLSLAKLRLQGDKNGNTRPRQPGGKDAHAYPWDRSSLKSLTLDLRQFKKLDAYASQVMVKSGLDELVCDLLQEADSELERVRAIWIWICHHIEYDVEAAQEKDRQAFKPTDILRSRKTNCDGYAGLFERMCRSAGCRERLPRPPTSYQSTMYLSHSMAFLGTGSPRSGVQQVQEGHFHPH